MFSSGLRFCYKSQISHATIKRTGWQFQISLITLKISKFYKKKKGQFFDFPNTGRSGKHYHRMYLNLNFLN